MIIKYINFWPKLDPESCWLTKLLRNYLKEDVVIGENCDILFHSCFGDNIEYQTSKAIKIYCTWENRLEIDKDRIKYSDFFFTHWIDDFNKKNIRLPLWYLYIDWWNSSWDHYSANYLNIQNNIFSTDESFNRTLFCSLVASNFVSSRMDMFRDLSLIDESVGYGLAFGKYCEENKYKILHKFRFNLCFENKIASGYNTEKLFEAKFAGCIPLYYGDPTGCDLDFNPKSFINYYNFANKEDFLNLVKKINKSKAMYEDIHSEWIFKKMPSLDFLHHKLDLILKNEI